MKRFNYSLFVAALAAASFMFSACDDDDENVNNGPSDTEQGDDSNKDDENEVAYPEQVFTSGMPTNMNGTPITTDENGFVTQIADDGSVYTFVYSQKKVEFEDTTIVYDLAIEYKDTENDGDPADNMTMYCKLNKDNFIAEVHQVYGDGDTDSWTFGYNADGQLNYMKRSEGNEVTTLTYNADGDVVTVKQEDLDDKSEVTHTIAYTSDAVTSKIVNKGNIMLFDDCLGVDMDEMEVAYYAGLLGKATKHLPVFRSAQYSEDYSYTETYSWTLNADGLPTKMTNSDNDSYTFAW